MSINRNPTVSPNQDNYEKYLNDYFGDTTDNNNLEKNKTAQTIPRKRKRNWVQYDETLLDPADNEFIKKYRSMPELSKDENDRKKYKVLLTQAKKRLRQKNEQNPQEDKNKSVNKLKKANKLLKQENKLLKKEKAQFIQQIEELQKQLAQANSALGASKDAAAVPTFYMDKANQSFLMYGVPNKNQNNLIQTYNVNSINHK